MARPKKAPEERRDDRLEVRLTARERAALDDAAAAHGQTAADFVRHRALGYRLPPTAAAEKQKALAATALIRLGVNLNQIAHRLNAGHPAAPDLHGLVRRVEAELERLYAVEE